MSAAKQGHLVLSRRANESVQIVIDGVAVATVTINKIKGNTVSLGVKAPVNVKIVRSELVQCKSE